MTILTQLTKISMVLMVAVALGACSGQGRGEKEIGGTLIGAAAGGLLGSQFGSGSGRLAAIAAGTLLGAWVGNEVGKSLDRADRLAMAETTHTSLETGRSYATSTWYNPDSGHGGTITPEPAYQTPRGEYCREYQQTVNIGGRTERAYGTACRQPDGSWRTSNG